MLSLLGARVMTRRILYTFCSRFSFDQDLFRPKWLDVGQ